MSSCRLYVLFVCLYVFICVCPLSVKLAGGRGMNVGYIYNQSGELAITATQEALIRMAATSAPPSSV